MISFDPNLKAKIIEKGIIGEEEWPKVTKQHFELATFFLLASEMEEFNQMPTEFDEFAYTECLQKIQDQIDLDDCDKVLPDKSFDNDSVRIGIPTNLIPFMRGIIEEIQQEMENER